MFTIVAITHLNMYPCRITLQTSEFLIKKREKSLTTQNYHKEMATHSRILAWRIPWIKETGVLQSMGHKESHMTEWPAFWLSLSYTHCFQERNLMHCWNIIALSKLPSISSSKMKENSSKICTSALLTMPKSLSVWVTKNCGKFLKRWEYQTTLHAS